MASPSAPDHLVPQAAFRSAAFFPVEESIPSAASMPAVRSPAARSRSRATASRATASRNATPDVAAAQPSAKTNQRKRRATPAANRTPSTSTPRKRARTVAVKKESTTCKALDEDDRKLAATESCCICMCEVEHDDLAGISGCEHKFCFECIRLWSERENKCPLCKVRFTKIDRVNKKRKKGTKNTMKVKQRDQRSDFGPGAALEGLLATLSQRGGAPNIARLIFSGATTIGFASGRVDRRHAFFDEHPFSVTGFSDDDDEDDDESPLSSFIRAFHSVQIPAHALRPVTVGAHASSRSYASNSNDRSAGNRAENPLEIDDDSDDDVVEVVGVNNPTSG